VSEIKKTIIYFLIALLFLGSSFYAGFRVSNSRAEIRITELAERASNLENQLAEQTARNREITSGLRWSARTVEELTKTVRTITEENNRIRESIDNIGSGTSEDIERLSSLYDRVSRYAGQDAEEN
jgi:archaellum component FlaC